MAIKDKININKGKLPYRGRGLENSIDINSCSIEEQRRFGLERLAAALEYFHEEVLILEWLDIFHLEIQSSKIIFG